MTLVIRMSRKWSYEPALRRNIVTRIEKPMKIILILLLISVVGISVMTLKGEGITFQSIRGSFMADGAFSSIAHEQYTDATDYFLNEEIRDDKRTVVHEILDKDKKLFADGLEMFFDKPSRILQDYRVYGFRTDNGYTSGYVELMIEDDGIQYAISMLMSFSKDKLYPMNIEAVMTDSDGSFDIEILPNELFDILKSYNQG